MMPSTTKEYNYSKLPPIIQVYFDGLCQPFNPGGIACYAFVIIAKDKKQEDKYGLAAEPFSDDSSNNVAEYTGVIKALEWLLQNNCSDNKVIVKGDSELVIFQIKGKYKVKASRIIPLYTLSMNLISKFKSIDFEWIPREQNKEADALSYKAYQETLDSNPALYEKVGQYMATEKQLGILRILGIEPDKYLSKMEANRLISKLVV
jgi:ribonuclease HI